MTRLTERNGGQAPLTANNAQTGLSACSAQVDPLRVIGVDHGLHHTGYGLLIKQNNQISCLAWGTIDTSPKIPFAQRLKQIYHELIEIIERWTPDVMVVESAIYAQNVHTALLMGHARGAALLAAANSELEIFEYSPKKIKSAVVGNGAATKEQVRFMITRILNLPEKDIPFDASDALAAGICHLNQLSGSCRMPMAQLR